MNTNEIIQKSVSGAKWTIILSIIAMPLGYIVNIILGRISPEALGIYGLLSIFVLSVTTFILFGGGNVIIKYLPEIDKDKKVSFLASYILIVFLIAIFAISSIYLYPQILELIFGQDFPSGILPYLIIFIPIIILYSVFDFALNGLMEIKTSVIIRQIVTYGNFIVFVILFLFYKDFFREHLWMIIWGLSFVFYIILGLLALFLTTRKMKITSLNKLNNLKPYLPTRFWSFALFVHLSTIVFFAYDKIDQLFILNYFSIRELGLYYAALQTAMLIRFVPMLLGSVLLPTFSNLLASNEIGLIQKGYREVVRYNTLMVVPAALLCIFFSRQIMGLFGAAYVQNHLVLVILGFFFGTAPIGGVNSSLVIAKGRTGLYFILQIIMVSVQLILTFSLIQPYGVVGAALAKGIAVSIGQIGLIWIVLRVLKMGLHIPRQFFVGIAIIVIATLLYCLFTPSSLLFLLILFSFFVILFLYLGKYTKKDIDFIWEQLHSRK